MHAVAACVPGAVVDLLEVIEIAEEHAGDAIVTLRPVERMFESVDEQPPVREPGERIVQGPVFRLAFRRSLLRDVDGDAQPSLFGRQAHAGGEQHRRRAVGPTDLELGAF